jgi:carbamoylphosphate synthase large subunit
MAIGRNFEEAFQKALRMIEGGGGATQVFIYQLNFHN